MYVNYCLINFPPLQKMFTISMTASELSLVVNLFNNSLIEN